MIKIDLGGIWHMQGNGYSCEGTVPGSVYSFLLGQGLMKDPHYRMNENDALAICDGEYTFSRTFEYIPHGYPMLLHCDGLDTICAIQINKMFLAQTDNMHRTYEWDITPFLHSGINEISLTFSSADAYIKAKQRMQHRAGSPECLDGFSHLRKAHCMMGWDWGPRLPDAGIWRPIYLLEKNSARLTDIRITQRHDKKRVWITVTAVTDEEAACKIMLASPDGNEHILQNGVEFEVERPQLWWPNGLGEQPLYTVETNLLENGISVDKCVKKIGLRTLKLIQEEDEWGRCFCHEVNGLRMFAMGADYIPEDNILSRCNRERTKRLLEDCRLCHFNAIRVWGGGIYPEDWFFELCDELGLVVFMDMMFACCEVPGDEVMLQNTGAEARDNLRRIRHHACLGLISGNNEIEAYYSGSGYRPEYTLIYEKCLPEAVAEVCPEIPYVSSSPSSGGSFDDPQAEDRGDQHYWSVWHGGKPFGEYRKHHFRYLSEFGFQSFPCEKTIATFTEPEDRNIFSRVMEMHQRNGSANGKILLYLSDHFLYPKDFGILIYTTQLLQAEAMRTAVEHLRRERGRCMGTLFWQLNDIWPGASWASIDYFGRWKALQYYARRFFAPVLLSCNETGEQTTRPIVTLERTVDYTTTAQLCVTNDTQQPVIGVVRWALRDVMARTIRRGEMAVQCAPFSAQTLPLIDFQKTDVDHHYISYELVCDGQVLSEGTTLFTAEKYFAFADPRMTLSIDGDRITVTAQAYAKAVEIDALDDDLLLSDNFFDMNAGSRTIQVLRGDPTACTLQVRSVYDIR